jgi:hypothetical protein
MIDSVIWAHFFEQEAKNKDPLSFPRFQNEIRKTMAQAGAHIEKDCAYVALVPVKPKYQPINRQTYLGNILHLRANNDDVHPLDELFLAHGYTLTYDEDDVLIFRHKKTHKNVVIDYRSDISFHELSVWEGTKIEYYLDNDEVDLLLYFEDKWMRDPADTSVLAPNKSLRLRLSCDHVTNWVSIVECILRYEKPPFALKPDLVESFWIHVVDNLTENGLEGLVYNVINWNTHVLNLGSPTTKVRMFLLCSNTSVLGDEAEVEPDLALLSLERSVVLQFGLGLWQLMSHKVQSVLQHLVRSRLQETHDMILARVHKLAPTFFSEQRKLMWNQRAHIPCTQTHDLDKRNYVYAYNKSTHISLETFYYDDENLWRMIANRSGVQMDSKNLPKEALSCTRVWDPNGKLKPIYGYLSKPNHLVFFFPWQKKEQQQSYRAWCSNQDVLEQQASQIFYECFDEDSMQQHASVQVQRPVVQLNIADFGIYISKTNYDELLKWTAKTPFFMVYDTPFNFSFSVSQQSMEAKGVYDEETGLGELVSAEHCQAGSNKHLSLIYPIHTLTREDFANDVGLPRRSRSRSRSRS